MRRTSATAPIGDAATTPPPGEAAAPGTRDLILDVALELFNAKGFDGTSLREISDRLGITKAALYYYFPSKEDIIMALHMRMHEVGKRELVRLSEGPVTLDNWRVLLESIISEMVAQRSLFLMHQRNQAVLERIHQKDHDEANDDVQARLGQIFSDPALPLRDRVRMACSFGAVFGLLAMSGEAFEGSDGEELDRLLRDTISDVLKPA